MRCAADSAPATSPSTSPSQCGGQLSRDDHAGDRNGRDVTQLKASRADYMLEEVRTAAGAFAARTFAVNVRNSRLILPVNAPGGSEVRLNGRERGVLHWDDKLTLEFATRVLVWLPWRSAK